MSAHSDRNLLAAQYPLAFTRARPGQRKMPLKFRIIEDLIQRGVMDEASWPLSDARIAAAVRNFKNGALYCHAIARGGYRIDLDGQPCGLVDYYHQKAAQERVIRMGWQNHDAREGVAA
jgi:sRNA-binding protein